MANKTKDIREILNQYNIPWKYGNKGEVEATVKNFSRIIEQERTNVTMIKMNPQNKQYYSTEFIKGWEQGVKDQYETMLKNEGAKNE